MLMMLTLKLKLQHFDHLIWRTDSLEKTRMLGERLRAGGEGDDRGWEGWMASPTQWTWVWASSRSWGWTGRPGMLQSVELQRVRHDWAAELNWFLAQATLIHFFATISCSFPKHCTTRTSQVALVVKSLPACRFRRCKRHGFDPWVGRSPGGGHGNPLQYSCLENPMDRGTWWAIVHRVAQSQIWQKWLSTWYAHSSAKLYKNGPKLRKTHLFSSSLTRWSDRYYWNPHLCFGPVVKTPALPIHSAIINSFTTTCHTTALNTLQSSRETGGLSAK